MPAYFGSSGILLLEAKRAYERMADAPAEDAGGHRDALSSILFAAAALEAWIAEIALFASGMGELTGSTPQVAAFRQVIEEAERTRGSVRLKFMLAKVILTGEPYDKGAQPYQDFDLLFSLRDALVHMKPEAIPRTEEEEPRTEKLVVRLSSRAGVEPKEPRTQSSWLDRIATRSVARWACNTAANMVESIRAGLEDHVRHPILVNIFASPFRPVE